jgi:uncharacterized iron-regulated membrane protein
VFYNELDRHLNPQIQVVQAAAEPPSMQAVQQQLQQAYPQRLGAWRVELPLTPSTPLAARYYQPEEKVGRFFAPLMLTLEPSTLQITSQRFWGDYLMTWLFDLHYTLLLEDRGRQWVGWIGLFMSVSLACGVYLWWPSSRRLWPALKPQLRPGVVRATYDAHALTGVYTCVLLLVLCLTGVALAWPQTTQTVLGTSPTVQRRAPAVGEAAVGRPLDLDAGLALARQQFPQAEPRWVELPARGQAILSVRLHQPQEPGRRFPQTQVWVDLAIGQVVAVNNPFARGAGYQIQAWLHPLHNGEAFGLVGRVLACVCGLVPLVLLVSGYVRWRHKSRARALVRRARVKG